MFEIVIFENNFWAQKIEDRNGAKRLFCSFPFGPSEKTFLID